MENVNKLQKQRKNQCNTNLYTPVNKYGCMTGSVRRALRFYVQMLKRNDISITVEQLDVMIRELFVNCCNKRFALITKYDVGCFESMILQQIKDAIRRKDQEHIFKDDTDLFEEYIIRILRKNMRNLCEEYIFDGTEDVVDFYNAVLTSAKTRYEGSKINKRR